MAVEADDVRESCRTCILGSVPMIGMGFLYPSLRKGML